MRVYLAITKARFSSGFHGELHIATTPMTNLGPERDPVRWVEVDTTVEELNKLVESAHEQGLWCCWCSDPHSYDLLQLAERMRNVSTTLSNMTWKEQQVALKEVQELLAKIIRNQP